MTAVRGPEMFSVAQVAALLHVGSSTVRRLIDRGELPAYRIGAVIRVRADDLTAYMHAAQVRPEGVQW